MPGLAGRRLLEAQVAEQSLPRTFEQPIHREPIFAQPPLLNTVETGIAAGVVDVGLILHWIGP